MTSKLKLVDSRRYSRSSKFYDREHLFKGKVLKRIYYLICSKVLSHLNYSTYSLRHFLDFYFGQRSY